MNCKSFLIIFLPGRIWLNVDISKRMGLSSLAYCNAFS